MKAIQRDSDEESPNTSSEKDDEFAMLTREFKKYLRKKNFSRQRDFKKNDGKKSKEVICFECDKPGHIRNECPRLKFKGKGANEKKKTFKATWDDSSKFEMEEEN